MLITLVIGAVVVLLILVLAAPFIAVLFFDEQGRRNSARDIIKDIIKFFGSTFLTSIPRVLLAVGAFMLIGLVGNCLGIVE